MATPARAIPASEPHVFETFQKFRRMVKSCVPVTIIPQKTRVVFMVRMRFAGATVRKRYFRIDRAAQLDQSMLGWIHEARDSGTRKHFERRGNAARREKRAIRR